MSLSGSPRSRCTITVCLAHTCRPAFRTFRHVITSLRVASRLSSCHVVGSSPFTRSFASVSSDLLSFERNPSRKYDSDSIVFRSPKRAMRLRSHKIHENRSRVSTRMRTYFRIIENNGFDLSSRKVHTWIKFNNQS